MRVEYLSDPEKGGLFGNPTRARLLMALELLRTSYPRELARLFDMPVSLVVTTLNGLERAGIVSSVMLGRTRQVSLNPRYFAFAELSALLNKLALANPGLLERVGQLRRRPRRPGKPL